MNTGQDVSERSMAHAATVLTMLFALCSSVPMTYCAEKTAVKTTTGASNKPSRLQGRTLSFQSGGRSIRTEWFEGSGSDSPHPVVVLLHGSGGIEPQDGFFRQLASTISASGFTAVIVHYLDRNGLEWASGPQMGAHFSEWMSTVRDAITWVQKQPGIDPNRISLLGHSLGAQLGLQVAAKDCRVNSVIDMAGCFVLPTKSITRMPPVLVLHGTSDNTVPLSRERKLIEVLKRTKTPFEEQLLQGGDHAFNHVAYEAMTGPILKFLNSSKERNNSPTAK